MITCTCLVQEGQAPASKEASIRTRLRAFTQTAFDDDAQINWIIVPQHNGFTAAKPSTSSLVSLTASSSIDQDQRARLLGELCDLWMSETGCSMDEIVGVISDPADA